jgi:hypothetical protein
MYQNIRLISILLILNFIGYAFSLVSGSGRGIVNIDYLLLLFLPNKALSVVFLFFTFLIDLFISYASVFRFTPISFIENSKLAFNFDYRYNIIAVIFFFPVLSALMIVCKKITNIVCVYNKGKMLAGSVFLSILIISDASLGAFYSNGLKYNSFFPNPLKINVSTSGFAYLAGEVRERHFLSRDDQMKSKSAASAIGLALNNVEVEFYPKKIALIIIESYGSVRNKEIQNYLLEEFDGSIKVKKSIRSGEIPFSGATTSAEMRELCGIHGDYRSAMHNFDSSQCLPNRLTRLGYHTSGFHYYYRSAFNRAVWWPHVGLNDSRFLDAHQQKPDVELCGGFLNGGCDKDLIDDLFASMDGSDTKTFSYGLTLNSHLPVHNNRYISQLGTSEIYRIGKPPDSIDALVRSWRVVLKSISNNINARPDLEMLVVIVGDHPPPFLMPRDRGLFSNTHVPYIILKTN